MYSASLLNFVLNLSTPSGTPPLINSTLWPGLVDFQKTVSPTFTLERWNVYDQTSHEVQLNGSFANVEFTAGLYMFEKEHTQDWSTGGTFWGVLFGGALSAPGQWELCQDFFEPTYSVACDPTEPAYPTGTLYQILYSTQKTESSSLPLICLGDNSPITNLKASTRLDFPHPFGPTIPVRPFSIWISVGSTNDLKPLTLSVLKLIINYCDNILSMICLNSFISLFPE